MNRALSIYTLCALACLVTGVSGHGTGYTILSASGVRIRAFYDSGDPMALATVLVFPPGRTEPAQTVEADSGGVFTLYPSHTGIWTLQVRDGTGHGMRINLDINEKLHIDSPVQPPEINIVQKLVMAACVVWGFIGTAFYFASGKKTRP